MKTKVSMKPILAIAMLAALTVLTSACGAKHPGPAFGETKLEPTIPLTIAWTGEQIMVEGPVMLPVEFAKSAEYKEWKAARDERTIQTKLPTGEVIVVRGTGFVKDANGKWQPAFDRLALRRRDKTLARETDFEPTRGLRENRVYDERGNLTMTMSMTTDLLGNPQIEKILVEDAHRPDKEWLVNSYGMIYAEKLADTGEYIHYVKEYEP